MFFRKFELHQFEKFPAKTRSKSLTLAKLECYFYWF
jgi:hypothetical protein